MKLSSFVKFFVAAMIVTLAVTGCHKRPVGVTDINGTRAHPPVDNTEPMPPITGSTSNTLDSTSVGIPTGPGHPGWPEDREKFKDFTVHFDFDSSVVKGAEKSKVEAVATQLKNNPTLAVKVEGHCDERGTEEYNRSLGERRALALREELARLGIDPNRVDTISYGEDKPMATGHDEAAWKQNRRGEFIALTPPK
jgi:peptidoglycan-associated lipoprotein